MPLRLRVMPRIDRKAGDRQGPTTTERIVEFEDDVDEIRIGRRRDAELSLPFPALSGLHARLVRKRTSSGERGVTWVIEDLDSKNGTFIGNDRLKPGQQRLMLAGDQVDLAHVRVIFDGHSQPTSGAEGTATIARRLVNDLFLASPGANAPTLSVISEAGNVTTLKLVDRDRPYFIGRGNTCDLRINIDELSRQHASFTRGWNGVVLRDLASKNGIQVNGVTVTVQRLSDGDVIQMGPLKLRMMDPEERYLRELEGDKDPEPAPAPRVPTSVAGWTPPAAAPPSAPAASAAATPAAKPSRFAKLPSAAAAPPPVSARPTFDEHHPAISPFRPPADHPESRSTEEPSLVRRARRTMFLAAAVLAAIVVVGLVLVLGGD